MAQTAQREKSAKVRSDGRTENAQFMFLNRLRRERSRVEIYLVSGTRLQGRIQSFDGRMLLLATETGAIALYHQATATVQRSLARPKRGMPRLGRADRPRRVMLRPPAEPALLPAGRALSDEGAPMRAPLGLRSGANQGGLNAGPAAPPVVIKRRRSKLLVKPDED